jgi:ABC-type lipoprotein release transport system permease subunit
MVDLEKILNEISTNNPLYYAFLSSIAAAIGLTTNSIPIIIGSMIISPIGNIIARLSIIIKLYFEKKHGFNKRKFFEVFFVQGLGACVIGIIVGYICGMIFAAIQTKEETFIQIPTNEMKNFTQIERSIGMVVISVVAGLILPEAIKSRNYTIITGISIAIALVPPATILIKITYMDLFIGL